MTTISEQQYIPVAKPLSPEDFTKRNLEKAARDKKIGNIIGISIVMLLITIGSTLLIINSKFDFNKNTSTALKAIGIPLIVFPIFCLFGAGGSDDD